VDVAVKRATLIVMLMLVSGWLAAVVGRGCAEGRELATAEAEQSVNDFLRGVLDSSVKAREVTHVFRARKTGHVYLLIWNT
jgi:hypothetical protein